MAQNHSVGQDQDNSKIPVIRLSGQSSRWEATEARKASGTKPWFINFFFFGTETKRDAGCFTEGIHRSKNAQDRTHNQTLGTRLTMEQISILGLVVFPSLEQAIWGHRARNERRRFAPKASVPLTTATVLQTQPHGLQRDSGWLQGETPVTGTMEAVGAQQHLATA